MTDKPLDQLSKNDLIKRVEQLEQRLNRAEGSREIDADGSYHEGDLVIKRGDYKIIKGLDGEEIGKLLEVVFENFTEYILQPAQLDTTLKQLVNYHETLNEWKELHDHLDEILKAFWTFAKQVWGTKRPRKIEETQLLLNNWYEASEKVESLLLWAKTIQHIGIPYGVNADQSMKGERWAVRISKLKNNIEGHLGLAESRDTRTPNLYPPQLKPHSFRVFRSKIDYWWLELVELSGIFENAALEQMHFANKRLLKTARKINTLSERTFVRANPAGGKDDE